METIDKKSVFDNFALEYDKWFDKNKEIYNSEILALKEAIPKNKKGLEVGVGTGRFAEPLGVEFGVEPSEAMALIASNFHSFSFYQTLVNPDKKAIEKPQKGYGKGSFVIIKANKNREFIKKLD